MICYFTPYRFKLNYDAVLERLQFFIFFLKLEGQTLIFVSNSVKHFQKIKKYGYIVLDIIFEGTRQATPVCSELSVYNAC